MKTYIVTDETGMTAIGLKVAPGKHTHTGASKDGPLAKLRILCKDTPLLAALANPRTYLHPRLFSVHVWDVSADPGNAQSYTQVKEEAERPPAVTLEHKLGFALAVLKAVYRNREFQQWADKWIDGTDRGEASARGAREAIEKEMKAAEEIDALAAWGTAGTDSSAVHAQDKLVQRALRVTQAVETAARENMAETKDVLQTLAPALVHLDEYAGKVDLAAVAAQVAGGTAPAAAPSDAA